MKASTTGIHLHTKRKWFNQLIELLSSMRFAITLLSIISIASVIGTVIKQNEPLPNYVNQFGGFWFQVFDILGLYQVYNATWFLIILGFLVVSTTLCVTRNAPKMLKDMRSFRAHVRESSLKAFPHNASQTSALSVAQAVQQSVAVLKSRGFSAREVQHEGATLIAAKTGSANRLGYIFAHSSIVIICIGGLLDSDLAVRMIKLFGDKQPIKDNMLIAQVPESGRLPANTPTFRGSSFIAEGQKTSTTIINTRDGALVQPLPFTLELKKFIIEYYSTGMPKLFASEVQVTDNQTGKQFTQRIEVNKPLIYRGITVYQSSFDDGGSAVKLVGYPLQGPRNYNFSVQGNVGGQTTLQGHGQDLTLEFTGLRPFNVENMSPQQTGDAPMQTDKAFKDHVAAVVSPAANKKANEHLRNLGPSVQYKLRDPSGQATEFSNYMVPVTLDGVDVFLVGMRSNPNEQFRYVRLPADAKGTLNDYMLLRAALFDQGMRAQAATAFAQRMRGGETKTGQGAVTTSKVANPSQTPNAADAQITEQLRVSSQRALDAFSTNGLQALANIVETNVPAAEQERAAQAFAKLLEGVLWELWVQARAGNQLPAPELNEASSKFFRQAMMALSDSFLLPAPVLLQLDSFEHKQASVFQVTRTPGKYIVYLGCLLLVLGVFAMFYIQERRIWVWIKPDDQSGASHIQWAMTATRRTLDFEREVQQMRALMEQQLTAQPASTVAVPNSSVTLKE